MMAGVRPSEFWDLTPVEYNIIVEAYRDKQKESLYRDIRNDYYIGCFAQAAKPQEFYETVLDSIDSKPQSETEMFNFLKSLASKDGNQSDILDSHFNIPLKLTPKFDVSIFNYIYRMESETLELYLPDVNLSLNGHVLKPNNGVYTLKPGLVKVKYNNQVYTIIMIRS